MANSKAQAFKEKGNAAFKSGDYPTAIGHYTSAILADTDRKDVTFPLNRAAAYLKLGKYADTERDCNIVLSISGPKSNVKALFRRGQARVGLGKLLEAKQDFTDVITQEPSNSSASDELKNVTNLIQKEKAKKSKALPGSVASPSTTSTPEVKRRRVPIRIVGDTNGATSKPTASKSSTTKTPTPQSSTRPTNSTLPESSSSSVPAKSPNNDTLQAISSRSLKQASPAPLPSDDKMDVDTIPASALAPASSTSNSTPQVNANVNANAAPTSTKPKQESFKEAKQARDAKSPRVGGGIFRVSGQNTIFASRGGESEADAAAKPAKENAKEKEKEKEKEQDVDMEIISPSTAGHNGPASHNGSPMRTSPSPSPSSQLQLQLQPPPTTLFDFSRTWYSLKSPWERWAFLNTIPPAQFPALCKTSLEPSLLVSILDTFLTVLANPTHTHTQTLEVETETGTNVETQEERERERKARIRAYMEEFARIPRFTTLVLFLSKSEKEVARGVWRGVGVDRPDGVWKSVGV